MRWRSAARGALLLASCLATASCDACTPSRKSSSLGERAVLVEKLGETEIFLVGEAQRHTTTRGCDRSGWVNQGDAIVLGWAVEVRSAGAAPRRWRIDDTVASSTDFESELASVQITDRCHDKSRYAFRARVGSSEIPRRHGARFVRVLFPEGGRATVATVAGASCPEALGAPR